MTKGELAEYTYKKMLRHLALIAILMIIGMAIYEMVKQLVFPTITIWQSHFVTIVFSTFFATVAAFFILRKHVRLSKEIIKEKDESDELRKDLKKAYAVLDGIKESFKDIGVFALDNNLCYISFNQTHREVMKQMWGADIALGHCMPDYITNPDERKKTKERLDRALSGKPFTIEDKYGHTESGYRYYQNICNHITDNQGNIIGLSLVFADITDRKRIAQEREELIVELQKSLAEIKELRGILPICSSCKKIRDDKGYWTQIESYISRYSDAQFSHGVCPDCAKKLYGDLYEEVARARSELQTKHNGS